MKYLGHVITKDGIAVDPSKVQAVTDWRSPRNVADIRSFLGMASYYQKIVENFSRIAAPMNKLTGKGVKFVWSGKCEKSFQELKHRLTSAPILIVPDSEKDYTVYCDAS
jgi:hypothetical protein